MSLLNCFIAIALLGAGVAEIRGREITSSQQCLAPATSLRQAPSVKLLYRELRERTEGVRSIRLLVFSRLDSAALPQLRQIMAYHTSLHLGFTNAAAFQSFHDSLYSSQARGRLHNLASSPNPAQAAQNLAATMGLQQEEVVVVDQWALEKPGSDGVRLFVERLWRYLFIPKHHALVLREMTQASPLQIQEYLARLPREVTENINFLEALVWLYRHRQETKKAEDVAYKAVELLPENLQAWTLLITTLTLQGKFQSAYSELREARQRFDDHPNLKLLMLGLYKQFRKKTSAVFHESLELSAEETEDWLDLLEWVADAFPKTPAIRYALVKALWQAGYPEEALQEAEDIRKNFPQLFQKFSFKTLHLRILIDEASYQGSQKNFKKANALFQKGFDFLNPLRRANPCSKLVKSLHALFWREARQHRFSPRRAVSPRSASRIQPAEPRRETLSRADQAILDFISTSEECAGVGFLEKLAARLKEAGLHDPVRGLSTAFIEKITPFLRAGKLEIDEKIAAQKLVRELPYHFTVRLALMRALGIPLVFWMYAKEQEIEKKWATDPAVPKLTQEQLAVAEKKGVEIGAAFELDGAGEFVKLQPVEKGKSEPKFVATTACGHPYLTRRAYTVLEFIAAAWVQLAAEQKIPIEKSQLLVNDASRTEEDQRALLTQPNSTAAPFSSHLTGFTFDLWAKWFKYNDMRQARILLRIFTALQEAGVINLLDEGHVWHVAVNPYLSAEELSARLETVRRNLTPSADIFPGLTSIEIAA